MPYVKNNGKDKSVSEIPEKVTASVVAITCYEKKELVLLMERRIRDGTSIWMLPARQDILRDQWQKKREEYVEWHPDVQVALQPWDLPVYEGCRSAFFGACVPKGILCPTAITSGETSYFHAAKAGAVQNPKEFRSGTKFWVPSRTNDAYFYWVPLGEAANTLKHNIEKRALNHFLELRSRDSASE